MTLFDTADVYREHGVNEELLGRALAGRREQAVIATKFGHTYDEEHAGSGRRLDGRPEYVKWACEQSLAGLAVGHIDLYYLHRPPRRNDHAASRPDVSRRSRVGRAVPGLGDGMG